MYVYVNKLLKAKVKGVLLFRLYHGKRASEKETTNVAVCKNMENVKKFIFKIQNNLFCLYKTSRLTLQGLYILVSNILGTRLQTCVFLTITTLSFIFLSSFPHRHLLNFPNSPPLTPICSLVTLRWCVNPGSC